MKAILVIDTDKEIIERLSKMNVKEMCVDIGFDYDLDCNGRGGWCFHRPKSLLSIKPIPQKQKITEIMVSAEHYQALINYKSGWDDCIDEIIGGTI